MRSTLFFLAVCCGLGGCGTDVAVPTACAGDNHCPAPNNSVVWAVQLLPSTTSAPMDPRAQLLQQDHSAISWGRDGSSTVSFRSSALIEGKVVDAELMPLPIGGARVVARLPSVIPGQTDYNVGTLSDK